MANQLVPTSGYESTCKKDTCYKVECTSSSDLTRLGRIWEWPRANARFITVLGLRKIARERRWDRQRELFELDWRRRIANSPAAQGSRHRHREFGRLVGWKVYQHEDGHNFNTLQNFKVFQEADKISPLYARGMTRVPKGQFEYDAINLRVVAHHIGTIGLAMSLQPFIRKLVIMGTRAALSRIPRELCSNVSDSFIGGRPVRSARITVEHESLRDPHQDDAVDGFSRLDMPASSRRAYQLPLSVLSLSFSSSDN
jgi:hypothetical protein